jgi:hypothetical protein
VFHTRGTKHPVSLGVRQSAGSSPANRRRGVPFRCNEKLLFCLCRTCVLEQNTSDECESYTAAERALTGTWVTDEVRLAVEKGCRLLDIHEVYQYQVTQYNRATGEGGLFVDYINKFLNSKLRLACIPAGFEPLTMQTVTFNCSGKAKGSV